jgi:hypothetical protein
MSVLVIGGDKIDAIRSLLAIFGASCVTHWDARKKSSTCKKIIPMDTDCIVMLTSFLNHNAMKHFRSEAKKRELPIVCSKHNTSSLHDELAKVMRSAACFDCQVNCHMKGVKDGETSY